MAELIKKTDNLNQGREKLNAAITDAEKAKVDAGKAVDTSGRAEQIAQTAEDKADNVQSQFDQVVIEGDSSVEAAQARVPVEGEAYPTLKARLDTENAEVTSQLAQNEVGIANLKSKNLEVESSLKALGNNNSFHFPSFQKIPDPLIVGNNDPSGNGHSGFDFAYATVLKAYENIESPIDNYYMYVASHDGDGIYLYTSPKPEGPWSVYSEGQPIITSEIFSWGLGHISSPDVQFDLFTNSVLLYIHTPTSVTANRQYTSLVVSSDGISFSPYGNGPILKPEHEYRWNGISTTYFKTIKVGSSYYGVYQANNGLRNGQIGDVTTSIGMAYSENGYDWSMGDTPFFNNPPNSRGPFSPSIIYWMGYFLVLYRLEDTNIRGVITQDFETFEEVGVILSKGQEGEWDNLKVATPFFMYESGKLYMYYGGFGREQTGIGLAVAGVENI